MTNTRPRILFSAPCNFMPKELFDEFSFEIVAAEVWHVHELAADEEAVGWVTNTGWSFRLGAEHLNLFPRMRVVITPSTGSDHIRIPELAERGLQFYSLLDDRAALDEIAASAEHAFLLLLNSLRRLPFATRAFDQRKWRRDLENDLRGRELQGRVVGLLGFGRIGKRVARYCQAFGACTQYYDPHVTADGVTGRVQSVRELFQTSDTLLICCTYSAETEKLVGYNELREMRFNATLVNIARGEIVDEAALAAIIRERPDLQVSLDVLRGEPLGSQFDSPIVELVDQNRVLVTPHIGGSTIESQSKAARIALKLLQKALEG